MKQITFQVSFNPKSPQHRMVVDWINEQTTNRSSFIRETLVLRMMGMLRPKREVIEEHPQRNIISPEEARSLIEV